MPNPAFKRDCAKAQPLNFTLALMNPLQLNVAGATVRHETPFASLGVPVSAAPLPADVREQWVRPLYFGLRRPNVPAFLVENLSAANDELIGQLLAHFDWRSRVAATLLVALRKREAFADHIGRLLLRSDVCYAGATYCLALASFNSPGSIEMLKRYLDYYLERKDLWFDQNSAMAALAYLDLQNETREMPQYLDRWSAFVADKESWNLERSIELFAENMATLKGLQLSREG